MGSPGKRVLVVEDSPVMRALFQMTLQSYEGVRLDQADDGMAGLQAVKCAEIPYDLILLDLNMPVMDGMKFLQRLGTEPKRGGSVVAVVTTEPSEDTAREARALGASYVLHKPVTRKQVDAVIREVFEAR